MAAEVTTISRVYLKPKELWKSAYHTAYCAPNQNPKDPNNNQETYQLIFNFGVARHVPLNVYKAFEAAGIATTDKPKIQDDDDD